MACWLLSIDKLDITNSNPRPALESKDRMQRQCESVSTDEWRMRHLGTSQGNSVKSQGVVKKVMSGNDRYVMADGH